jgi:hypothetical protein
MMLIKLAGGPLDGQERELDDPNMMAADYPGYSPVEQVLDPERGQLMRAEWTGVDADEAYYDRSEAERERFGNETGIRDRDAQDRARTDRRESTRSEPGDRSQGETTGAQKRDAKDDAADAKRRGAESRETKQQKQ